MTLKHPHTPAALPAPDCPLAGREIPFAGGELPASPRLPDDSAPVAPAGSDWQETGEYAEAYASFFEGGARGEMLHTPLPAAAGTQPPARAGEPSIPPPAERPTPAAKGKTPAAPAEENPPGTAGKSHEKRAAGKDSPPLPPEDGSDIWSRRVALSGLLAIYRVALDGARAGGRGKDGEGGDGKFNPTAANTAIKAIEVANRMMGYAAPAEEEEKAEETENAFSVAFDAELAK